MSNLEINEFEKFFGIFLIQLFPNWTACSPITYTNINLNCIKKSLMSNYWKTVISKRSQYSNYVNRTYKGAASSRLWHKNLGKLAKLDCVIFPVHQDWKACDTSNVWVFGRLYHASHGIPWHRPSEIPTIYQKNETRCNINANQKLKVKNYIGLHDLRTGLESPFRLYARAKWKAENLTRERERERERERDHKGYERFIPICEIFIHRRQELTGIFIIIFIIIIPKFRLHIRKTKPCNINANQKLSHELYRAARSTY